MGHPCLHTDVEGGINDVNDIDIDVTIKDDKVQELCTWIGKEINFMTNDIKDRQRATTV